MMDKDYEGKVPMLKYENYFFWKTRMISIIDSRGPTMLRTLEVGPFQPMKTIPAITEKDGEITPEKLVPKFRSEFSPEEEAEVNLDRKVRNIIFQGLTDELFVVQVLKRIGEGELNTILALLTKLRILIVLIKHKIIFSK